MSISFELSLTAPRREAEKCSIALEEISPAIAISDIGEQLEVQAWFAEYPEQGIIDEILGAALDGPAPEYTITPLLQEDWVAKSLEGLKPVIAGPFAVHGRHDRGSFAANLVTVEIEAGLAFGTGHHGTTLACLLALDACLKAGRPKNILDLGTGTGVLAIAAAKRLKTRIYASDIDPVAVAIAAQNAALNNTRPLINPVTAPGMKHRALRNHAPYELIIANILARPLASLAPSLGSALAPGGRIILSGLLVPQIPLVLSAYRIQGLVLEKKIIREGWATLTLRG